MGLSADRHEQDMALQMINTQLSQTDRRAIVKSRQFGQVELDSAVLFANRLCREDGLRTAFAGLSTRERACLHLLALYDEAVSVDFFGVLYSEQMPAAGSFTQRYKKVFNEMRRRLLRRGLLLWTETGRGNSRLERYRFALPVAVVAALPPFTDSGQQTDWQPERVADPFRAALISFVAKDKGSGLKLRDGSLYLDHERLSRAGLQTWRELMWYQALRYPPMAYNYARAEHFMRHEPKVIHPPVLIRRMLSRLPAGTWVSAAAFNDLFALQYMRLPEHLTLSGILDEGVTWQVLDRITVASTHYYRLALPQQDVPIGDYLQADAQRVQVDMRLVPITALMTLSQYGDYRRRRNQLLLLPNLQKLSETPAAAREGAIADWLCEHCAAFKAAFVQVAEQRGQLLVHQQLYYARVQDLSLRVALEQHFKDGSVRFLPEGWLAFPAAYRSQIEAVVRRNGHVVRWVSDGN